MSALWIFKKFPILFILLWAFLAINQHFEFVPTLQWNQGIIIPIIFIAIGVWIIVAKKMGKMN